MPKIADSLDLVVNADCTLSPSSLMGVGGFLSSLD